MPIRRKEEPVVDRILECLLVYMYGYQYQYLRFSRTGNDYIGYRSTEPAAPFLAFDRMGLSLVRQNHSFRIPARFLWSVWAKVAKERRCHRHDRRRVPITSAHF